MTLPCLGFEWTGSAITQLFKTRTITAETTWATVLPDERHDYRLNEHVGVCQDCATSYRSGRHFQDDRFEVVA